MPCLWPGAVEKMKPAPVPLSLIYRKIVSSQHDKRFATWERLRANEWIDCQALQSGTPVSGQCCRYGASSPSSSMLVRQELMQACVPDLGGQGTKATKIVNDEGAGSQKQNKGGGERNEWAEGWDLQGFARAETNSIAIPRVQKNIRKTTRRGYWPKFRSFITNFRPGGTARHEPNRKQMA